MNSRGRYRVTEPRRDADDSEHLSQLRQLLSLRGEQWNPAQGYASNEGHRRM